MTRRVVDDAIGISLSRMGVECLDLLQFHWWDYNDKSYFEALQHLADLQHEGKIRHLALTNFDIEVRLNVAPCCTLKRCSVSRMPAARHFWCGQQPPIFS
jgi:aryl-alcohol dehydrogenase-like predicted oxidoreductase